MQQHTNKIIATLSFALIIALIYDLNFYRKAKVYKEDLAGRNQSDAKVRTDFTNTKLSRAAVYSQLKIDSTDIVFLGNSLTEAFPVTEYSQNIHVKNRGVAGYITNEVLSLLPGIVKYHPRKIFIEIGINDIKYGLSDKPKMEKELLDNYTAILGIVHKESPKTVVYVQSILPINKVYNPNEADTINSIVKQMNNGITSITNQFTYFHIDLYSRFAVNDSLPMKYTTDGIHLNDNGYALWYETIKKDLN